MKYELSARLARILQYSKKEAARRHLRSIGSPHLLLGIMKDGENRAAEVLRQLLPSPTEMENQLENALAREPRAERDTAPDDIRINPEGERILKLTILETRWAKSQEAGSEHLLLALLRDYDNEAKRLLNASDITYDKVARMLNAKPSVRSGFGVADDEGSDAFPSEGNAESANRGGQQRLDAKTPNPSSDTPVIDNYGTDLTQAAAEGCLDPVVGRQAEIERMAQILCRRKKNNPVLIGEPGVGKSALVEGLAQLIAGKKAPRLLCDKRIVALEMASIVAGTQYRGQFEERLRRLVQELRSHPEIILFIDEIHTIIGAGSAPGSLDAANILKPALARGEVQCIGATTTGEYRKTIEKDGALERRFQKIQLEPTSPEETLQILRNIKDKYEEHHHVSYTDDALKACVALTERYVTDRSLPDKAIDALDEAGSRSHLSDIQIPTDIQELEQEVARLKEEKIEAAANQKYERAAQFRDLMLERQQELDERIKEWQRSTNSDRKTVGKEDIAEVVSMMSGVPVSRIAESEGRRLKDMKGALQAKIIAQDRAIERLVRAITRNRLGIKDPNRPVGTFMFVGPTGVGKTYLVKTLAEYMFGSADALIRVDMSEYGEKHTTSRLVGAPPGYVGYEEGGQLTEKVRRHPYSIVLFDEIEKAHSDIFNTLLQVMDEGRLTDGNGRTVDFRNTIIVMTSNSGSRQLKEYGAGIGFNAAGAASPAVAEGIVRKALQKQFAPEFLNRLDDIIMFDPLTQADAAKIAAIELEALVGRISRMGYRLELAPEVEGFVTGKGFDAQYGARSLKRTVQEYIEDLICELLMSEKAETEAKGLKAALHDGTIRISTAIPQPNQQQTNTGTANQETK